MNTDLETIETTEQRRNRLLKGFSQSAIKDAWFALTHLFLDSGAVVADMGCGEGAITFAMAAMRPDLTFVGVDKDRRAMNKARATYDLENLSFKVGDLSSDLFDSSSLNAVININTLHSVYSHARYNEQAVHDTVGVQFKALKKSGLMFIKDHVRPPPGEFVMIEMPDEQSDGEDVSDLSDADFLEWYAEHARPKHDPGTGGFFLEELPPRIPNTRLYRLPYQWAYEFILRKDDRARSLRDLPTEYTVFTAREFRKALITQNARVTYSAPFWDDELIAQNYHGRFKLYEDSGRMLSYPPTCYVAVAQKMTERKSLYAEERRPAPRDEAPQLMIAAMRNQATGRMHDVVTPDQQTAHVMPYVVDDENRLFVYLKEDIIRSIANAVPRAGVNIDQKSWSAHMIETPSVALDVMTDLDLDNDKKVETFLYKTFSLTPARQAKMEKGPSHYPAPDFIQEYTPTYYIKVKDTNKTKLRRFSAQQVLDAISLGMIPNGALELQIMALFKHVNIKPENWQLKQVQIKAGEITGNMDFAKIIKAMRSNENRFKDVKGSAGELRAVRSVFVQDGVSRGALSGLHADHMDFVVHENETVNKAVVMPLTKNMKQEIHAGFLLESLPVPEKMEGKTNSISAPSFIIPPDITDEQSVRAFIAKKFAVLPEMVIKMGEPYFCHVSLTPQKIYPYGVAVPPDFREDPNIHFMPLFQLALINRHHAFSKPKSMTLLVARSYKYLGAEMRYDAMLESDLIVKAERSFEAPDWGFPVSYKRPEILDPVPEFTMDAPNAAATPSVAPVASNDVTPLSAPNAQSFHTQSAQANNDNDDAYDDIESIDEILDILANPEPSAQ